MTEQGIRTETGRSYAVFRPPGQPGYNSGKQDNESEVIGQGIRTDWGTMCNMLRPPE